MSTRKHRAEDASLDTLIDGLQLDMQKMNPVEENFKLALARLKELRKLKDENRPNYMPSPDTIAIVCANLLGIVIITQHERINVMTSKATGFVQKLR